MIRMLRWELLDAVCSLSMMDFCRHGQVLLKVRNVVFMLIVYPDKESPG